MTRFIAAVAIALLAVVPASAAHIDLFFAGGQSNAKPVWGDAIETTLAASGQFGAAEVVHTFHSGDWLSGWWRQGERQENYLADFYDPSPTSEGAIERRIREIEAAGDTWTVRGLFWFQGEGDTGSATAAGAWGESFLAMIRQVEADLGIGAMPLVIAQISGNPDFFPGGSMGMDRFERIDTVRAQQLWAAENADAPSAVFDTGAWPRNDAWHLNSAQLTQVGEGMANAYLATIPEPATFAAFAAAGVMMFHRRRH